MTSVAISRPVPAAPSPLESPIGQMIEPFREQLSPFLKDGITLERVAAELILHSRKTPNLDKCPAPALVDAVCRALTTGGTIGQDVYIVPFFTQGVYEPTVMLDYKFKTELVIAAGGARSIDARPVWSDEKFSVRYGTEPEIDHVPAMKPDRNRTLVGAYAVAFMGFNHPKKIHFMPIDEVEAIRKRSKQWNPEKVKVCPGWYACARAVHQLVKLLPKNPRLKSVLAVFDREEREEFGVMDQRPSYVDQDGVDLTADTPLDALPPGDGDDDLTDAEIADMDRKAEQQGLGIAEPQRKQRSPQAQGR